MIRGLQKQMIQLSTPKSKYFEVVCFVLRPEFPRESNHEGEMLREAQKILAQSELQKKNLASEPRHRRHALFWGGLLCGCVTTALLGAILAALLQ